VECSRSTASVAMVTAVSNPKVRSVLARSLSIVLGTATTGTSSSLCSLQAVARVPSPPITMSPSSRWISMASLTRSAPSAWRNGSTREVPRMVPP
jgi:hypothetical protein